MSPEVRRVVTGIYLRVVDQPAEQLVSIRAGDLAWLVRVLFCESQRADRAEALRREERLDAAEERADRIFHTRPAGETRQLGGSAPVRNPVPVRTSLRQRLLPLGPGAAPPSEHRGNKPR